MDNAQELKFEEFYYRVQWRPHADRSGLHRSSQIGSGFEVNDFRPFGDGEDPRRFDVRAGIKDPLGRLFVRRYKQEGSVNVLMLADISASLDFTGTASKKTLMASFLASLALSVYRNGDVFGFHAAAEALDNNMSLYKMRHPEAAIKLATELNNGTFSGRNANGLLQALHAIPAKKSLIFLVSDFYLPTNLIEQLMLNLSRHMVIPVVLRDSAESLSGSAFGIANVYDSETQDRKMILLRPGFAKKLRDNRLKNEQQLFSQLARYGRRPLILHDTFSAEVVSQYFLEY